MANIGDIWQIRVTYEDVLGEVMNNVFYYVQESAGSYLASTVLNQFKFVLWDAVRALQPSDTVTTRYQAINGMDNGEQALEVATDAGTNGSSTHLPSFVAIAFRQAPAFIGESYAYKRIGGISNQLNAADGKFGGAFLTAANAVKGKLGDVLLPAGISLRPCIITGGFRLGVPPTLQRTLADNFQVNLIPTSQNTRKQYEWQS